MSARRRSVLRYEFATAVGALRALPVNQGIPAVRMVIVTADYIAAEPSERLECTYLLQLIAKAAELALGADTAAIRWPGGQAALVSANCTASRRLPVRSSGTFVP